MNLEKEWKDWPAKSLRESELFAGQLKYTRFLTLGNNEVHQMPISLFMADI